MANALRSPEDHSLDLVRWLGLVDLLLLSGSGSYSLRSVVLCTRVKRWGLRVFLLFFDVV